MLAFALHRLSVQRILLPLAIACALAAAACGKAEDIPGSPNSLGEEHTLGDSTALPDTFAVALAKWYGDRAATISLTYDHGLRWLSPDEKLVQEILREEKVPMDFDFTNSDLDEWPVRRDYYLNTLIPTGINVFGHGYEHLNSDTATERAALDNFRRCYDDMVASGIKPVAYAYPGGMCYAASTRRALAASGFLCGRRFNSGDHRNPWICPGDRLEPDDWFNLPGLVMYRHEVLGDPEAIHSTTMLLPFLDGAIDRRAWLIATYHEIKDGLGGTYAVGDFRNDIAAIKKRDFWVASFCDATLYLYERARARVEVSTSFDENGSVRSGTLLLSDDLPNHYFDHPLTVRLSVPHQLLGRGLGVYRQGRLLQSVVADSSIVLLSLLPDERPYTLQPM